MPWPNAAACWSPAQPVIGISAPRKLAAVDPKLPLDRRTSGRMHRGTPKMPQSSSLQPS
jgi:hypothetical protein